MERQSIGDPEKVNFSSTRLSEDELLLRVEVREFLRQQLPRGKFEPGLGMSSPRDQAFSKELAKRGWIGMALPAEYGGAERSAVERFIVVEELLSWGAPVDFHWIADRQSGPSISKFGSLEQKRFFLPQICRAEISFSIGMSEPDSGSDLAAVRTSATKVDGGYRINGTKIWTSGAHQSHYLIALCRTQDLPNRHDGLSQFIIELSTPGITVNPIRFIDGSHHFNEVVLEEVFVPDWLLLGEPGQGWLQNTSELASERAGPERWISSYLVAESFLEHYRPLTSSQAETLGELVARWWAIRQLSLSVARMIDSGTAPTVESALVKEMATRFEQDVLAAISQISDAPFSLDACNGFERLLAQATLTSPSFTIRGGTNEVLRGIAAKGLR